MAVQYVDGSAVCRWQCSTADQAGCTLEDDTCTRELIHGSSCEVFRPSLL